MSAESAAERLAAARNLLIVARTPRLQIRYKMDSDAIEDYQWARDADSASFNGRPPTAQTFEAFQAEFEREVRYGPPLRQPFAIDSGAGQHIGNLLYYNADPTRRAAEFGMMIGVEAFRGSGLGREAVVGFLRYAWHNLPFGEFYLHTLEWNERAQRSFTAAGFDPVARVERGGLVFVRMEARREWWLLHDMEGRFGP